MGKKNEPGWKIAPFANKMHPKQKRTSVEYDPNFHPWEKSNGNSGQESSGKANAGERE
jgi:hypothetical protein